MVLHAKHKFSWEISSAVLRFIVRGLLLEKAYLKRLLIAPHVVFHSSVNTCVSVLAHLWGCYCYIHLLERENSIYVTLDILA